MPTITLTTDFGEKDHYVGAVKGAIYSKSDAVRIVDISHTVSPFNCAEASYILKNTYKHFAQGTVHIIGIDSEYTLENKHLAVLLNGHFFICANNGLLSLIITEETPEKIIELKHPMSAKSNFPVLEVFVDTACKLINGEPIESLGEEIFEMKQSRGLIPVVNGEANQIIGTVIYIDNYGNVVSNIHRSLFEKISQNRDYQLSVRSVKIKKIHDKYSDFIDFNIPKEDRNYDGEKLAIFNSSGYLELAVFRSNLQTVGGASTLLGLNYWDTVTINFI